MKTTLWATLTANGNYQRNDPRHPPRPEALADFAAHVERSGNFVVGRTTFEAFAARPSGGATSPTPMAGATIVVVSRTMSSLLAPNVLVARSPGEALSLLEGRGFSHALLAGGAALHNAFLAEDRVDELVLDVAPVLEDDGFKLVLPKDDFRTLSLLDTKALGGGVVQTRYVRA